MDLSEEQIWNFGILDILENATQLSSSFLVDHKKLPFGGTNFDRIINLSYLQFFTKRCFGQMVKIHLDILSNHPSKYFYNDFIHR